MSHRTGRTLAIGDIHGCNRALGALLDAIRPTPDDLLIFLGDYSSRGLDSRGVLDRMVELRRQFRVINIRGNHEEMMMDARGDEQRRQFWLNAACGDATLMSYDTPGREATLADVPPEHWAFMERDCVDWYETETHIYVHGGVEADLPMDRQIPERLRWKRFDQAAPHCSGKIVICGHTPQKNHRPLNLGHSICLDTAAGYDGPVTCLHVESGTTWSADERGDVLRSTLPLPEKR